MGARPAPIKVPVCSGLPQSGTNWNLEAPFRTTRLLVSLTVRRAQVCLGFLYRTLKHTYKPRMGGMFVARCAAGFAKLDALMAKVRTAIERLQEYRTALISAAVTGQIDVRSVSTL